ncbi:hypothetical protein SASPL_154005 [Salvia splendens]|uniref:Uncharacterized protein n=1 Tax=Salvia splendens TaxID=180675 RepID=A0A8X8VZA5_SALSN|nr:hypothetical protein SASPL_154005 [Salvia splendens]
MGATTVDFMPPRPLPWVKGIFGSMADLSLMLDCRRIRLRWAPPMARGNRGCVMSLESRSERGYEQHGDSDDKLEKRERSRTGKVNPLPGSPKDRRYDSSRKPMSEIQDKFGDRYVKGSDSDREEDEIGDRYDQGIDIDTLLKRKGQSFCPIEINGDKK